MYKILIAGKLEKLEEEVTALYRAGKIDAFIGGVSFSEGIYLQAVVLRDKPIQSASYQLDMTAFAHN